MSENGTNNKPICGIRSLLLPLGRDLRQRHATCAALRCVFQALSFNPIHEPPAADHVSLIHAWTTGYLGTTLD